jgi:hypothetical protein
MKQIGFVALWLVATCAAVAVAWAGVSVVDDEIVDPAPAREIAAAVADDPATAGDDSIPDTVAEESGTTTTSPDAATDSTTPPSTAPTTSAGPTPTPTTPAPSTPAPSTPAMPSTTTTTTAPPPSTTTTAAAAPAQTQQFNLVGGSTAISFSATGVTVLWANPNPGFDVDIEPESPGWKVEFRSDDHRSRIDVWWSGGPRHEIREEPDN